MNLRSFNGHVKTTFFLNIPQLCVSQVRYDPDTLWTQDQSVAENEMLDPESLTGRIQERFSEPQSKVHRQFPEIRNRNECLQKPFTDMTMLAPAWQLNNYFGDLVMQDWILNSQFTYTSLNVKWRRNIVLSWIVKTICNWNFLWDNSNFKRAI